MRNGSRAAAAVCAAALVAALPVASETPSKGERPFVLVLGTAQDGGIPHLGGSAAPDVAARRDPAERRLVASLLVVDPASRKRWLVDATPDVAEQLERAEAAAPLRATASGRTPILD